MRSTSPLEYPVADDLDAGLRDGAWPFVNDRVHASAYQRYDVDARHYRCRTRVPNGCGSLARVQFES